jgi:excisionase family DNA binding protein
LEDVLAGRIMTVGEIAEYLSLDPQTVSRKAQSGELPAFKVGNRWRFDREDIDKWIREQKKGGGDFSIRVERVWDRIRQRAERAGLKTASVQGLISEMRSKTKTR